MIKFEWQRLESHKNGTSCFIVSVLVSKSTKIFLAHLLQRTMSSLCICCTGRNENKHCKIVPLVDLISIHDFGAGLKFNMATKDGI